MANPTDTEPAAKVQPVARGSGEGRPPWALVSKGWIAVTLVLLAWIAMFLLWNGLNLLFGA